MNSIDIKSQLEKDPKWTDEKQNTLLHYAAQTGDKELIHQCIKKGVNSLAYNHNNENAADIAIAWGHDDAAHILGKQIDQDKAIAAITPLPYKSIQEIREQSEKSKTNIFYTLAAQGLFNQVAELAVKNNETLKAEDLLSKGPDGDSVALKICQRGQLENLMKPDLWVNSLLEISHVYQTLPKVYRESVDFNKFLSNTRQEKLKSRRAQPKWKTPNR